jgi:hypothetical protein
MLSSIKKMIDAPRIADRLQLSISGALRLRQAPYAAYTLETGQSPTAEQIMERFGVGRDYAESFLRRHV